MKQPIPYLLLLLFSISCLFAHGSSTIDPFPPDLSCDLEFTEAIAENPNTIRIPFTLIGRLITFQAKIESVEGTFILDTGAERLLLNKNYFKGSRLLSGKSSYGSSGKVNKVWQKTVDTLHWDNLKLDNVAAHVIDLSHIEQKRKTRVIGILGYEVLKNYELFLDYPSKQIVLTKLNQNGYRIEADAFVEKPIDSLDFKLAKHAIIIEGHVQGIPLKFNLDTGAELNLIDRNIKRDVLNNFKMLKRVKLVGVGQKEVEVMAGIMNGVKCGILPNYGMRTLLTSLDEISNTFGTKIDGVLGFEFLRSKRTLINYKRKKLYFFDLVRP
jgi:hypothetical protein